MNRSTLLAGAIGASDVSKAQSPSSHENATPAQTSHDAVTFTVYGMPQTKGSARAFVNPRTGRAIVTTTNRRLKAWEQVVAAAAQRYARHYLGAGVPVSLSLVFYLPRPQRPKCARPVTRPDCSKLVRATEDALTKVLYADDSQVVRIHAEKHYAEPGEPPHVWIKVARQEIS